MDTAQDKRELFERMPVRKALLTLAVPTVISQLIGLIYNMVDTFFIGRTGNSYMMAAVSLSFTLFMMTVALSNLFGIGGGSLMARLSGQHKDDRAKVVSAFSVYATIGIALAYSLLVAAFLNPLLYLLGASQNTIAYARQYVIFVIILGGVPTILGTSLAHLLRNVGYSRQASIGLSGGGILNIGLDPLFMFVIFPEGYEVAGAAFATMLSNIISCVYLIVVYQRLSRGKQPGNARKSREEAKTTDRVGAKAFDKTQVKSVDRVETKTSGTFGAGLAGEKKEAEGHLEQYKSREKAADKKDRRDRQPSQVSALPLSMRFSDARQITGQEVKNLLSVGVPSAILTGLFDVANIFLNALMAAHGDLQLAAIGIVQKVERVPNAINIGICQGMLPLVAYNFASGDHKRMRSILSTARRAGLIISFISLALFELLATGLIGIFMDTSGDSAAEAMQTIAYGTQFLRIRCLASPVQFLNYSSSYSMQGVGDGRDTLIHACMRELGFYIPFMFLLNHFFGEIGLVVALPIGEGCGAILAVILLENYIRKHAVSKS